MDDQRESSGSSTATIVVVLLAVVLAFSCIGGVVVLGAGFVYARREAEVRIELERSMMEVRQLEQQQRMEAQLLQSEQAAKMLEEAKTKGDGMLGMPLPAANDEVPVLPETPTAATNSASSK